jgi:hypothetical protein
VTTFAAVSAVHGEREEGGCRGPPQGDGFRPDAAMKVADWQVQGYSRAAVSASHHEAAQHQQVLVCRGLCLALHMTTCIEFYQREQK